MQSCDKTYTYLLISKAGDIRHTVKPSLFAPKDLKFGKQITNFWSFQFLNLNMGPARWYLQ